MTKSPLVDLDTLEKFIEMHNVQLTTLTEKRDSIIQELDSIEAQRQKIFELVA